MMYYTTVAGWMVDYFYKFASGQFESVKTDAVSNIFAKMISNPVEMIFFMAITVTLGFGFGVLALGVASGLERVNKVMMTGLLALIIVLALHSVTLDGASEGISFYLLPNWKRTMDIGIGNVITSAMNQAFFTLSLGIGSLEIFGSYMSKEHRLTGEAVRVAGLDTFVALISGLIIFPACFSYNVEPDQGPSPNQVPCTNVIILCNTVIAERSKGKLRGLLLLEYDMQSETLMDVTITKEHSDIAGAGRNIQKICEEYGIERREAMHVGLAVEEMALYAASAKKQDSYMDVLVRLCDGNIEIDFRSVGERFDSLELPVDEIEYNIRLLQGVSDHIENEYIMGMNLVHIIIR